MSELKNEQINKQMQADMFLSFNKTSSFNQRQKPESTVFNHQQIKQKKTLQVLCYIIRKTHTKKKSDFQAQMKASKEPFQSYMTDAVQEVRIPSFSHQHTVLGQTVQETEGLQTNQPCFRHLPHFSCLFHPPSSCFSIPGFTQMLTLAFFLFFLPLTCIGLYKTLRKHYFRVRAKQYLIFEMTPWLLKIEQQTLHFCPNN